MTDGQLSPREREVLLLLARGWQNKQIADALQISIHTVGTQIKNIYGKLGIHNRAEASVHALRLGLTDALRPEAPPESVRILLVEDHNALRLVLKEVLTMTGYSVSDYPSVESLDAHDRDGSWDIAVLDRNLPGVSGLVLARRLRTRHPDMRIIMLTVHGELESKLVAYEEGVDLYLTKPFAPEELLAIVAATVKRLR